MSSNKVKRQVRRKKAEVAIKKQLTIRSLYSFTTKAIPGKFRKTKALNCGKPRCSLCTNPRRLWGHKTITEKSEDLNFKYSMDHLFEGKHNDE